MKEHDVTEIAFKNGYEKAVKDILDIAYENNSVFKRAIETYGVDSQLNVAIEEFSELIKEICKHKRGADNTGAIVEEMADCYNMLEQMQMIFGLDGAVIEDAKQKKIDRLYRRLEEGVDD